MTTAFAVDWLYMLTKRDNHKERKEKRNRKVPVPLDLVGFILLEVTLQQAFQTTAVSCFVAWPFTGTQSVPVGKPIVTQ